MAQEQGRERALEAARPSPQPEREVRHDDLRERGQVRGTQEWGRDPPRGELEEAQAPPHGFRQTIAGGLVERRKAVALEARLQLHLHPFGPDGPPGVQENAANASPSATTWSVRPSAISP